MKTTDVTFSDIDIIQDDEVLPIYEIKSNKKQQSFYATKLPELDKSLGGGIKDGDLVIVSGISGEGKTLLMQTFTYNYCLQEIPCLWFSYEIPVNKLHERFVTMGMPDFDYPIFAPKKHTTGKINWVKAKIKESWIKYGTKIVFIDMIDFLSPTDIKNKDNETIILKKIAIELKSLALELEMAIVVSAHITKIKEGEEVGMQHIAWSSGIYQMADYVIMVQRERVKQKTGMAESPVEDIVTNNTFVKIVKNRETGVLKKIKCLYEQRRLQEITNTPEPPTSHRFYKRADIFS